jgi:hypothetical protein
MKKMFFIFTMTTISLIGFSQAKFGVQAGVNIASQKLTYEGLTLTPSSKVGFIFGGVANIPISGNISLRPELNFIQKGSVYNFSGDKTTTTLN